ncbi:uncharacterized protein G2W53_037856 [Senna tora]|uniref:Uncharacterized protein n=1 Tax=Senna tora TaxID=362788 RepID=A0A834SN89_9FABA|nr:uncharacterized protein G2W53_037856 [Senna tora]
MLSKHRRGAVKGKPPSSAVNAWEEGRKKRISIWGRIEDTSIEHGILHELNSTAAAPSKENHRRPP